MRRAACLLILTALVASGCFASGSIETFVAAQKHRDVADDAADRWDAQARLVGVQAIESNATHDEQHPYLTERPDPVPGDGRAQAWLYLYASDARPEDWYEVVVAANATVTHTNVTAADEEAPAIVDWNVDSDAAAGTAADANATYRNASGKRGTTVSFFLTMTETSSRGNATDGNGTTNGGNGTDPVWIILVEGANESDLLFLTVNARNGTYLGAFSPGDFGFPFFGTGPPEESGTFQGQLTVTEPQNAHTFRLEKEGHENLHVKLRIDATAPQSEVNMTVEGPDGTTDATTWSAGAGSSGEAGLIFGQPARGVWSVTVRLDSGLAQDYEVAWCAPGTFMAPPQPEPFPPAC